MVSRIRFSEKGSDVCYFAMNGQTGEIVGKIPTDSKKLFRLGAIIFAVIFVLGMLGGLLV